jgi:tetraacyldisaccharide 4'-kinase
MPAPVVSVGNLAMGGRGKTPTAALVASLLVEAGERPSIISRGYKRERPEDGAVVVSDGIRQLADVARAGDEPVMMARRVPGAVVVVSEVRSIAAALAESAYGATVHVLDDGFQHRSLRRDIDLVLISPKDLGDRRLPFGKLRSSVRALGGADAIVVDDGSVEDIRTKVATLIDRERTALFSLERRLGPARWIEAPAGKALDSGVPAGLSVVALAGIARPERFIETLERAGFVVADRVIFRDHHPFTVADLSRVRAALRRTAAACVATTEKDAVRLLPFRPLGIPVAMLPLEVAIEPAAEFKAWLMRRLAEVRACRR